MNKLLLKLSLIDNLIIKFKGDRNEFLKILKNNIDEGYTDVAYDMFDVFTTSKNIFKGQIRHNKFEIKIRRNLLNMGFNQAIAEGKIQQENDLIIIKTAIHGFTAPYIAYYLLGTLMYSGALGFFMIHADISNKNVQIAILIFVAFAVLMMIIPYFFMRNSMSAVKQNLLKMLNKIAGEIGK